MRGRVLSVALGLAALVAVLVVPAALAAYASPKLEVAQTATGVVVKASVSPDDDATARVAINVPVGTTLTTNQAPGTVLGPVRALVRLLDNAGIDVPVEGRLVVGSAGQGGSGQQGCIGSTVPIATWLLTGSAFGRTLNVPVYLLPQTQPQFGPAFLVICLPSPDVPAGGGPRVKVYSAELTINGVFGKVTSGAWISSWVAFSGGSVVAPAAIAPGAVRLSARTAGRGAVVTGTVTQGGRPHGGATVTVLGGSARSKLTTRKRVRVSASGRFTARFAIGTFFRADAVATGAPAPTLCAELKPVTGATLCVNPTVNGFSVRSAVVRKR